MKRMNLMVKKAQEILKDDEPNPYTLISDLSSDLVDRNQFKNESDIWIEACIDQLDLDKILDQTMMESVE